MMYKNANGMLPPVMTELFTVNSNIHNNYSTIILGKAISSSCNFYCL